MPLFIEINETQTANYTMLSKRARDRVLKGVFHAIGMKWQKDMLPNHFTLAAKEKYGYRERTNKYKRRKLRAGHGITPLVSFFRSGYSSSEHSSDCDHRMFSRRDTIHHPRSLTSVRSPHPRGVEA